MSYSAAQHGFRGMNGFNSHEDGNSPQGKIEPSDDHIEDVSHIDRIMKLKFILDTKYDGSQWLR